MTSDRNAFATVLRELTDEELEVTARDYIWLAELQESAIGRTPFATLALPSSRVPLHQFPKAALRRRYTGLVFQLVQLVRDGPEMPR